MLAPKQYTWYLAGRMSGVPQFNFPMFDRVARLLRADDYTVFSPAELDRPEIRTAALASPDGVPNERASGGETWADFLARDVKLIADKVQGIIALPGWEHSNGARLEVFVGLLSKKEFAVWDENGGYPKYVSRDVMRQQLKENMP